MDKEIFRVMVKTTTSFVEAEHVAQWVDEPIYCGTSLIDARVAYLQSSPKDFNRGYGNKARRTIIEKLDAKPEKIDDETHEEFVVEG